MEGLNRHHLEKVKTLPVVLDVCHWTPCVCRAEVQLLQELPLLQCVLLSAHFAWLRVSYCVLATQTN